jgi:tetratricopeptide (TPR) repeat protein
LSAVFALKAEWPEAHALRGELQLVRGDVTAARSAFERALAGPDPNPARQHGYWCNLSQAYLRAPADARRALDAAERAIALDDRLVAGHYCRGSALRSLQRAPEAQQEFDHVLAVQPKHVGAMLARSQLAVENPGITTAQIDQTLKDIATALALAPTEALQAEAYYVQSLAWLKYHLADKKSEAALLNCQHAVWEAIQRAPRNAVYQKTADQVFNYAAGFAWQDKTRQQDSARLQQQYQSRPRD